MGDLNGGDGGVAEEPGFGDAVAAIHQPAASGEDDRVGEVSGLDALGVFGDGAAGGRGVGPEPAVLVEFGDAIERDVPDGKVLRELPEAFRLPIGTTARDRA